MRRARQPEAVNEVINAWLHGVLYQPMNAATNVVDAALDAALSEAMYAMSAAVDEAVCEPPRRTLGRRRPAATRRSRGLPPPGVAVRRLLRQRARLPGAA